MSARQGAAWHYTTGQCAAGIVADGVILPATGGVPSHERPVVWFSRLNRWEPTASKGLTDPITGYRKTATLSEMECLARGLYRFGVAASDLLGWAELQKAARIRRSDASALVKAGLQVGASPVNWMGCLKPVPLTQVFALQRLIDGRWVSDPSELRLTTPVAVIDREVCQ